MLTTEIKKAFTLGTAQLLITDSLVKMLLISHIEFANRYSSLRAIQRPIHRTIALKINISEPDKSPQAKVLLKFDKIRFKKLKFNTKKGHFQIQNLESDVYSITFTKAGYETLTIEIPITSGKRTQLKIILKPNL